MSKSGFELNTKTVGEILKSEGMRQALIDAGNQVALNAGQGYRSVLMSTRVIVLPETEEAEQDNLNNNTLLKAGH